MLTEPLAETIVSVKGAPISPVRRYDLNGYRILLAEDNPTNQTLIVGILKKTGAEVITADDGQIALDIFMAAREKGEHFDLILMDMQMPVMDGYQTTKQLRQSGYTGAIIALTAHAMDGDRDKCINAGCNEFVSKPINRAVLIETIQQKLHAVETRS